MAGRIDCGTRYAQQRGELGVPDECGQPSPSSGGVFWYYRISDSSRKFSTDREARIARRNCFMAYVIAEPCIGTKDSEKFAAEEMIYIDPVECIDCGACVPVCPVSAIFALDDLPEKWKDFTERNAKYFGR